MGIYDRADQIDPGAGTQRPLLPEGWYPRLRIERHRTEESRNPQNRGAVFFKADLEVLTAANGAAEGVGGAFLTQVGGNKIRDYDDKGVGQVKSFFGAANGLIDKSAINARVTGAELAAAAINEYLYAGYEVAARVTHLRREGKDTLANFEFHPVTPGQATISGSRPAAPAQAPAMAAPPPVSKTVPPGWARHPDPTSAAAGWIYEVANPATMRVL